MSYPRWINLDCGYTNRPCNPPQFVRSRILPWRTKPLFEFILRYPDPLILAISDDLWIMPDRHFVHDGGSIPPFIELLTGITREKHEPSFPLHDCGNQHGGYFISRDRGRTWAFCTMTRRQVDDVLYYALQASGAAQWEVITVDTGLAIGGWPAWYRNAFRRAIEAAKRS